MQQIWRNREKPARIYCRTIKLWTCFFIMLLIAINLHGVAAASEYPSYFTDRIEGLTFSDLEELDENYHPYTAGVVVMDASVHTDELFADMVNSFKGLTARIIAMHGSGTRSTELAYLYCFPHKIWLVETDTVYGGLNVRELDPPVEFTSSSYVQTVINYAYSICEQYRVVDTETAWKYAVSMYYEITGQEAPSNENSESHRLANEYMAAMAFEETSIPPEIEQWPAKIDVAVDIPKDVTVEEATFWLNHQTTFPAHVDYDRSQITGTFEAWEPGMYIVRLEAYLNGAAVTKEITLDASQIAVISPGADKAQYYQALLTLPDGQHPLDNDVIYETIIKELDRFFEEPEQIANNLLSAPYPYRDLFVWSLFDYELTEDTASSYFNPSENKIFYCMDDGSSDIAQSVTFFHEIGHAIDYNALQNNFFSCSYEYKEKLYSALYEDIEQIVKEKLDTATLSIKSKLTEREKKEILDFIMGEEYIDFTFKEYIFFKDAGPFDFSPIVPDSFSKEQKKLFETVFAELNTTNTTGKKQGSNMVWDMLAGLTNQVGQVTGHGPVEAFKNDYEIYAKDYWYDRNGAPTYNQNVEAWAEYYSSRITNENSADNCKLKATCAVLDEMAIEMLEHYKDKYRAFNMETTDLDYQKTYMQ